MVDKGIKFIFFAVFLIIDFVHRKADTLDNVPGYYRGTLKELIIS